MLPDVGAETAACISGDVLLRRRHKALRDALQVAVEGVLNTGDEAAVRLGLGELDALRDAVQCRYVRESFDEVQAICAEEPKNCDDIVGLCNGVVSELRARGWSDVALAEAAADVPVGQSPLELLSALAEAVTVGERDWVCFVPIAAPEQIRALECRDPTFRFVDELPAAGVEGRPLKLGHQARVVVRAFDAFGAAEVAHRRTLSTLGALTVVLQPSNVQINGEIVGVEVADGKLRACETRVDPPIEKRSLVGEKLAAVLTSSWTASARPSRDPLHDALRFRQRALRAPDPDSSLLLLWSAVERLTSGAIGFRAALNAAKELVAPAVTFGKLRRDVGDLAAGLEHEALVDPTTRAKVLALVGGPAASGPPVARRYIERTRLLQRLLAEEASLRELLAPFYDTHPHLVRRCHELWRAFGRGGDAQKRGREIAEYLDRSHERVSWQVGRIYRARNRYAHVGVAQDQVRDLVMHADFYLNQLIAICVHYGPGAGNPQDILTTRAGQYQAYLSLLRGADADALAPESLLRPSKLFQAA